jgi:hypothetical protein
MNDKLTTSQLSMIWESTLVSPSNLRIDIDISKYRFVTCEALIGICSLIEYCLNNYKKKCRVIMPELKMVGDNKFKVISSNINANESTLKIKLKEAGVTNFPSNLDDSRDIVRFLSFLYNLKFMNLWGDKVEFTYFERDRAGDLLLYSGQRTIPVAYPDEAYRRYTSIHRLHGSEVNRAETLLNVLRSLIERAPETHINSPLFVDDELKEVFIKQLAENVAFHAKTSGFVMARTFSREDLAKDEVARKYLPSCTDDVEEQCRRHGFFEIVIADSGLGIYQTLKDAYRLVLKKVFHLPENKIAEDVGNPAQVIEFALDEFGSTYLRADDQFRALINRHTLNQVFQYTRKYGGILRLISDGLCLTFDTNGKIKRGKYGLGFNSKQEKGKWPAKGLHASIILPHTPKTIQRYPKGRENLWVVGYPRERTLTNFRNIGTELKGPPSDGAIMAKAAEITQWALEKRIDQLTLDFSHTGDWPIDSFIFFLSKLENLSSFIHCWGINIPDIHITTLKTGWGDGRPICVPEERFLAFPCLDKERRLQLISSDLLLLSDGLGCMFKGEIDPIKNEYYDPLPISISDLFRELRSKCRDAIKNLDELKLSHLLGRHPHLFTCDSKGDNWQGRIDYLSMLESLKKSLTTEFVDILQRTGTIYRSPQITKEHIFQLPSTGRKVKRYYWTYNLLQIGAYTEQIARTLKAALDNKLFPDLKEEERCQRIDALLCATAPAKILAEAIAKLYQPSSPAVFDLGAVNELDPEDIKGSFMKDDIKKCIIVTDVVYTTTLINKLLQIATDGGAEVLAIAAIIRFDSAAKDPSWFGDVMEITVPQAVGKKGQKGTTISSSYPLAFICNYPEPEILGKELDPNQQALFWIEPYSLMPFLADSLINPYYAWEEKERDPDSRRDIPRRICLLDRKGYIRHGHFKNRNHHNRILIHMPQALQDEEIADLIFEDILNFTDNDPPIVIIVPLHSSINYLVPHINRRLRENSLNREVICTIAVDLKGRGPWYLFPEEAKKILTEVKKDQRRIMFLDDAILTGRTVETFLRAVDRFLSDQKKKVEKYEFKTIYIYCIINRLGRAASTHWKKTQQFSDAKFLFREFIRFECPVYTRHDCPLCKEIQRLDDYRRTVEEDDDRIDTWVEKEKEEREPLATVTRRHRASPPDMLHELTKGTHTFEDFLIIDSPKEQELKDDRFRNMDEFRLQSVDGALWWFWERSYRGSLPHFHLLKFKKWLDSEPKLNQDVKEKLLAEALLWALDNLSTLGLREQFENPSDPQQYREDCFFQLLGHLLQLGGNRIPRVLEKAGSVLITTPLDPIFLEILYEIISFCLEDINRHKNMDAVANITLGLYLIIIRSGINNNLPELDHIFRDRITELAQQEGKWQGFYQTLLLYLDPGARQGEFLYCLNFLLTLIYKEKHSLLFGISEARLGEPGTSFDNLGHLLDFLPEMLRALNIVFKSEIDEETDLAGIFWDIEDCAYKILEVLEGNTDNTEMEEMVGWIKTISESITDKESAIRKRLDYYHSVINDVFQESKEDYEKSGQNQENRAIVEIDIDIKKDLRIIGDRLLLRDTFNNHIWDVLEKHFHHEPRKIKVMIREDGEYTKIMILNNWLESAQAADQVKKGYTFNVLNVGWKRYGGELQYPVASDEPGYQSMLLLKARLGFPKEE